MDIELVRKWINTEGVIIPLGLQNALQIQSERFAKSNEDGLKAMKAEKEKTISDAQAELKDIDSKLTAISEAKPK
jgi:hypothetical protein